MKKYINKKGEMFMKKNKIVTIAASIVLLTVPILNPSAFCINTVQAEELDHNTLQLYTKESADLFIENEAEFFSFAKNVANGNTYEGKIVKLNADLDMSPYESFNGVGGAEVKNSFKGTFDGGGHTICNANVVSDGKDYTGLFNCVDEGCIKNLNVSNTNIEGNTSDSTGGLVGNANCSVISNCTFQGKVRGADNVGGIAGEVLYDTTIVNCEVLESRITGESKVGGIAGTVFQNSVMENSSFKGTVAGTGNQIGGLAGEGDISIKNCYVIPSLQVAEDAENIGIVVGQTNLSGSASACYYLQNDNLKEIGGKENANYKAIAYTEEQLKSEKFVKKLNANKVSYSAPTWTGWIKEENDYPRLAKINQIYFTKTDGVTLKNYIPYGEEDQTYSIALKKGTKISEIIPSVHLKKDGTKIESTYQNGLLQFTMPSEAVYMDFETIAVPVSEKQTNREVSTTPDKVTLYAGGNTGYFVKLETVYENREQYDITYSSDNEEVVTVSQNGIATAKKAGTAKIFVTLTSKENPESSETYTASTITVKKAEIVFQHPVKTLKVKQSKKLQVALNGIKGTVKWSVSNKKYASVNSKGVLKAKKAGKVKVTASCGTYKKICNITIKK